jgi:hypothetical protein
MKEKNNDIPFIKNNFREDDFLKIKSNNKITITESNSINDISLTVQNKDNENNIKMNEEEIKQIKPNFFNLKKIGNLIIISEDEKEIKYIMGPMFPILLILNISANIFLQIFVFKKIPIIFKTIGSIMNLVQIYFFIISSIKNPGLPSKDYEKLVYEEENKTAKNFRKCKDCKLWINTDEKTIHCKKCGICIEGYDHHCDCINICVGKKNLKNFYILILCSFLLIVYSIFIYMGFK